MKIISKNNEYLSNMLDFQKGLNEKLINTDIELVLYGSLSYAFFTGDSSIDINDIDLIGKESDYTKIINLMKNEGGVTYELTNHNSLRLFKNGTKISIHSQEKAREISNFETNVEEIIINGVKFITLGLDDLIQFYKKGALVPEPWKIGYLEKFNKLIQYRYQENYSFILLKPSILKRAYHEKKLICDIKKYIKSQGLLIEKEQEIIMSQEDIYDIYEESYRSILPALSEEKIKLFLEINIKNYVSKKSIVFLVKGANAIKSVKSIKGNSYWPNSCNKDSLRYIFRDKAHDAFNFIPRETVDVPSDNIIHCPDDFEEFKAVLIKWLL